MIKIKYLITITLALSVISCMQQHMNDKAETPNAQQRIESEPVKINIPVKDDNSDVENVDLSVTKRLETNFNMCIENKYLKITLTNEIDSVSLDNNLINSNICEQSIFSCEGTNTLHQTGARIVICPK